MDLGVKNEVESKDFLGHEMISDCEYVKGMNQLIRKLRILPILKYKKLDIMN